MANIRIAEIEEAFKEIFEEEQVCVHSSVSQCGKKCGLEC
jgi:hypothetical protein